MSNLRLLYRGDCPACSAGPREWCDDDCTDPDARLRPVAWRMRRLAETRLFTNGEINSHDPFVRHGIVALLRLSVENARRNHLLRHGDEPEDIPDADLLAAEARWLDRSRLEGKAYPWDLPAKEGR